MENDSDSICFIGKTLLRSPNSSFDKSDSLSIPNLLFTLDDVTYHRKCFQKQKPLPQCDTLREIDTFVSAHRSNFFIYLFFCCWRVKDCPSTSVAEFEGTAQQKLCGNYKPFTWHWHYTAWITISPRLKSQTVRCTAHTDLPRSLVSFSTWTKHIFRSRRGKIASSI